MEGWEYARKNDYETAVSCFESGLEFASTQGDYCGQAHFIHAIGCALVHQGSHASGLEKLYASLEIFEEINDTSRVIMAKANIANIYSSQRLHEEAERCYRQCLSLNAPLGHLYTNIINLQNISQCLIAQKKFDEAEETVSQALCYLRKPFVQKEDQTIDFSTHKLIYGISKIHLAIIESEKGNLDNANKLLRKILSRRNKYQNSENTLFALYIFGKYNNNMQCLEEALSISKTINILDWKLQIYEEMVRQYKAQGEWQRATEHLEASQALERELFSPKTMQKIEEIRQKDLRKALVKAQLLQEETEKLANQDSLTKLYNRRYIDMRLGQLWEDSQTNNQLLTVALMDIDNFKHVNDTYSHATGDKVLARVATLLTESFRATDIVGRYGGEEFIIILPEVSPEDAWHVCDRARQRIVSEPWLSIADGLMVTISAGICGNASVRGHEKMMECADALLYQAKRGGKNRVEITL
jgi:diguanylate cyclase (GGDEF)-like protein